MKEATGELSTTVIAIVAIAAILAVFTVFLLPTLRAQIALTQACSNGPGYEVENEDKSAISCEGNATSTAGTTKNSWKCHYKDASGNQTGSKTCSQ